jgi:predicted RNase H-like HicB family nuclease
MPRGDSHRATSELLVQYPLYVHRNGEALDRGSFPDFPGADASGNSFEELECNAQDRVQRMYDRSEHVIPAPNDDTYAPLALDMDDGKGLWIFVEIDLARVVSRVPAHPQLYAEFDHQADCDSVPAGVRSADDGACNPDPVADGDSHDRR